MRRSMVARAEKAYDYDVVIIGAGVGGHGAAIHAVERGLKTAVMEGDVIGGTCVNRGCVPSKALLAASGRVREMRNAEHLRQLASPRTAPSTTIDKGSRITPKTWRRRFVVTWNDRWSDSVWIFSPVRRRLKTTTPCPTARPAPRDRGRVTAKNIIIATGSTPFVPPGIEVDHKTVFTSDAGLKLDWVPEWVAIIGSGYIGLEFSDVYTALARRHFHRSHAEHHAGFR